MLTSAQNILREPAIDSILSRFGKEMTWDMKAGCMGKRMLLLTGFATSVIDQRIDAS